jgi:hypothetical protein
MGGDHLPVHSGKNKAGDSRLKSSSQGPDQVRNKTHIYVSPLKAFNVSPGNASDAVGGRGGMVCVQAGVIHVQLRFFNHGVKGEFARFRPVWPDFTKLYFSGIFSQKRV